MTGSEATDAAAARGTRHGWLVTGDDWYTDTVTFRHPIRVRYGECDMQGVVFNAHYLAYADDAVARWFEAVLPAGAAYTVGNADAVFDFMVKKAVVTWSAGSTYGDTIEFDCSVARWGNTSFDVRVAGIVGETERVAIDLTYVSVAPGTHQPCPVPDAIKSALS